MRERILIVDDDPVTLAAVKGQLKKHFNVTAVDGPAEALIKLTNLGPFAVIISDLEMPGMNGIQFLVKASEIEPDTQRIMLTGHAEFDSALDAVNEGRVYQFLVKPCPAEKLLNVVNSAVRLYNLEKAEAELLDKTLMASVKILTEILAMVSPLAFGLASRIERTMNRLARQMEVENPWEFMVAAMLSQIGNVTLPLEVAEKMFTGEGLSEIETDMVEARTSIAHELISNIPRLDNVADIIEYQNKNYDGSGYPENDVAGDDIPLGARALNVALEYDRLVQTGHDSTETIEILRQQPRVYDPKVIISLEIIAQSDSTLEELEVMLDDLQPGMIIMDNIPMETGSLVLAKGQEVTASFKARLLNLHKTTGLKQPIRVLISELYSPLT